MPLFRHLALRGTGDHRRATLYAADTGDWTAARDAAFRTGRALPDLWPLLDVAWDCDWNSFHAVDGALCDERDSGGRIFVEVGPATLAGRLTYRDELRRCTFLRMTQWALCRGSLTADFGKRRTWPPNRATRA